MAGSLGVSNAGVALGKRPRATTLAAAAQQESAAAASAASGGGAHQAPPVITGPTLQMQVNFADLHCKRIVMALQSGLKSELAWALSALNLLSFKEMDGARKETSQTPLVRLPGLLDALLHVIDEWRDVAHPKESKKVARLRTLGLNRPYTGFGLEYEVTDVNDPLHRFRNNQNVDTEAEWWGDEEDLFNLDEIGRAERQQCAVAASNVLRNFSFMPENEGHMAQNRRCLETIITCMDDHETEDEELVTNAVETILNIATFLHLKIFTDRSKGKITEQGALQAIMKMLESPVRAWNCSAAELLGRLVVNAENEPFLLPFAPQIYKRLVDMLSYTGTDSQAAAVGALYNFAEINMDCRLRLANERWAVARLLKIVQTPHSLAEVSRKAALTLESLASEPENRTILLAYEHTFAEITLTDPRTSDTFARLLWELSSRTSTRSSARGIWGS